MRYLSMPAWNCLLATSDWPQALKRSASPALARVAQSARPILIAARGWGSLSANLPSVVRAVCELADEDARGGIAGHRFDRCELAECLAVGAARLGRLRLRELILGEEVKAARDREEKQNDANGHEKEPGRAPSFDRLGRCSGGALSRLDYFCWL